LEVIIVHVLHNMAPSLFIQISDDEYEIHTNIDIASLFRWHHQARIKHMEKEKKKEAPAKEGAEYVDNDVINIHLSKKTWNDYTVVS